MKRLAIVMVVMKLMMPGCAYAVIAGGHVGQMPLSNMYDSSYQQHSCMRTNHEGQYTQAFCHVWGQQPEAPAAKKNSATQLVENSTRAAVQKASKAVAVERQR